MVGLADALFNKTKQTVLGILFSQPDRKLHLREIARIANLTASTIQKELALLSQVGILNKEYQGNQTIYSPNKESPIYDELLKISFKTFGIADLIRSALTDLKGIDFAFIYGSVARGQDNSKSDVDVMIIGSVDYTGAINALFDIDLKIKRTINPKIYKTEEFKRKAFENNSFIRDVLDNKKQFLIGEENEFKKVTARQFG